MKKTVFKYWSTAVIKTFSHVSSNKTDSLALAVIACPAFLWNKELLVFMLWVFTIILALLQWVSQAFLLSSFISIIMLIKERMWSAISAECSGPAQDPPQQWMPPEFHLAKFTYPWRSDWPVESQSIAKELWAGSVLH